MVHVDEEGKIYGFISSIRNTRRRKKELTVRPGILGKLPANNLSHNSWAVALLFRKCLQAARVDLSTIFHPLKARANILPITHLPSAETELIKDRDKGLHCSGHPIGQDGAPPLNGAQESGVGGMQIHVFVGEYSLGVGAIPRDRHGRGSSDQRLGPRQSVAPARRVSRGAVPVEGGYEPGEADGHGRLVLVQGRVPPVVDGGDQTEQGGRTRESVGLGDLGELRGELVGGGGGA